MELKLSKKSQEVIKEIVDKRLFEHPLALIRLRVRLDGQN